MNSCLSVGKTNLAVGWFRLHVAFPITHDIFAKLINGRHQSFKQRPLYLFRDIDGTRLLGDVI